MKQVADSDLHIETPEGIELALPLADPVARAYAFTIDFIIRVGLMWVVTIMLFSIGDTGIGLGLIVLFVMYWGYYVIFEMILDGSSPGKKILGLRVVQDDFTPVTLQSSIIRNLLRAADILPGFYGFALLSLFFSRDNKRLGDMAAKTIVISTKKRINKKISLSDKPIAPKLVLLQEEQRAIVDFAHYCETSSVARANEIAYNLKDVLDEENVTKLVQKLRQHAKWILGGR